MKSLKSIVIALALVAVCGAVKADIKVDGKLTKTHAINTYVDAMTQGKLRGFNDVLDKSAAFSMVRGSKVISFDKKQMMDYLQTNNGTEQMCTTSTSIVENGDKVAIVKVDMKFENFVRSNYVTLAHTDNGWKITSVYSVFS